jgi:intergrase/recombinase
MIEPRHVHPIMEKHVLRYLKGTIDYGLRYISDYVIRLQRYTNSYWAGSVTNYKTTSRCFFSMGSTTISWFSEKHTYVALSSEEAEYVETWSTCGEVVWLRKLIAKLFDLKLEETYIFYDNQSFIKLSVNQVFHDKSKHIDIKYHNIREMIQKGAVKLDYVPTDE